MSGKSPRKSRKHAKASNVDPRVKHTRDVLGDALVALIHEKPFDSITVQNVLDRAGVGRSTFYTHFSDKDDLFLSDAEDFFGFMAGALKARGDTSNRVAPVRELFSHVAEWHKFHAALVAAGKLHDVFELATGLFARGIDERLAASPRASHVAPEQRTAMGHALAGALFALLNWWLNHRTTESAEQMDETFHRMVWSGVSSASAAAPITRA
jgi:AcrR family transcriptional regulator